MTRLLIILAAVATICCNEAQAQVFFRGGLLQREFGTRGVDARRPQAPNRYRTPYPTSSQGISIGVGSYPYYNYPRPGQFDPYRFDNYVHDPYATGSFKAPDLLNDPYFRERHRYDSRFPGRYRVPAVPSPEVPYHPHQAVQEPRSHSHYAPAPRQIAPAERTNNPTGFDAGPEQLARSLMNGRDSDLWLEFLMPDQVSAMIAEGNEEQLRDLLGRYEGIQNSEELEWITKLDGFAATKALLRSHVSLPNQSLSL
ncbi:hypothetical protein [Stieleria varia]|uniref:Uncharacterized protein n=1 Tax=Stieleria varia TaxID=2528005 RepID=A0A5C5ZWK9_9BACT|nr:hypothetical protein [Stieleria varia]TWT91984.1 hypothetical protein Pla52n_64570 [Stieleria varia]